MKRFWPLLIAISVCSLTGFVARAGTLTYVAIPSTQSDANCGITSDHGYTTAIDGGNTRGTDRVLNGITLYSLAGAGQSTATADNCTMNALSGTLTDGGLTSKNIEADGTVREVMSDMVFNNAGGDNSQVEIVLDPESLEEGAIYDLRVYITSSSGQNRQVNLAFFGDGQDGVQTGFFNQDDARTSPGRFQSAGQVYHINYRYAWDGDSTPGITITQKFGGAPFCLYALTNELVEEAVAAADEGSPDSLVLPEDTDEGDAAAGGEELAAEEEAGAEGDEGLSAGFVEQQESDQIGVESDDFYQSESLNSNGRWVKLSKWGTCWQPTSVAVGWTPYTNGSWKECEDCGWTFVSDEPWAWACYHYGRWAKVSIGCGWAWVPGSVWAPSWVSWRQGRDESSIGWAPLPPEAGCRINVGISSWVDSTCNIGPDYYTFINIRDFGSDSYWGCNCIYDRSRNTTIIIDTFNVTNICYNRHVNIYSGGPDFEWCNTRIRQLGGKECGRIYVNRYDNVNRLGGKWHRRDGEQLGLVAPRIRGTKNPKFRPKIAESARADQIDHGWKGIKDRKQEQKVRNHIAKETKGRNPRNSPAKLPKGAAEKMAKHGGGRHGKIIGAEGAGQGAQAGRGAAGRLRPGGKGGRRGQMDKVQGGAGQAQGAGQSRAGAAGDQHPGKGRRRGQGRMGAGAGAAAAGQTAGGGFDQHPGKRGGRGQGRKAGRGQMDAGGRAQAGANAQGGAGQAATGAGGGGRRRPGQSLGKKRGGGAGAGAGAAADAAGGGAATAGDGQHPGRGRGRGKGARGQQAAGGGQATGADAAGARVQGQQAGAGRRGGQGRRNRGQGGQAQAQGQGGAFTGAKTRGASGQQMQNAGGGQAQRGGARRGGGQRRQQQKATGGRQVQAQGQAGEGQAQRQTAAGQKRGGGGGQGRRRQQQQQQAATQGQSGGAQVQGQGGGQRRGGGGGARRQQQPQQQQARQQQAQQQQRQLQQQQLQQQRQLQRQQQMQQGGGGGGRGGRGGGGGGGRRGRGATPSPTPG